VIVGALGTRGRACVDERGGVTVPGEDWSLCWWIGADDRVRDPAREPSVRQVASATAPVPETRLRVPGGDVVQSVYGIGGPGGLVVVEVENTSPAAVVVGFGLIGARSIVVTSTGSATWLALDGREVFALPFAPPRWTAGAGPVDPLTPGERTGPMPAMRDRDGLGLALLYPLSHRSRMRVVLATSWEEPGAVDLARVPDARQVTRGWERHLARGMRTVLPDTAAQQAVDLARTQVLLDPDPDAETAAALEDWGFDVEATWAWRGLSLRSRRRAARRESLGAGDGPAALLLRVRRALVREHEGTIDLLPSVESGNVEVHGAPTRLGTVGFALRRHGERAALLWEVADPAPGLVLRAPALDPSWSTTDPAGKAFLTPTRP